jgi:prepilin-type N-terminal cleavage/methylation domain-containing protein
MRMLEPTRQHASGEEGFSLLEVVVAMVILAVGLLAIGLAQVSAMHISSRSNHLSQATFLAQEQIGTFQATPSTDPVFLTGGEFPDPGGPITPDPTGDDLTTFQRRYTITPNQPSFGLTTVTVTVDWDTPSNTLASTSITWIKGQ